MGDRSSIEWTDATWNPVTGCTKVSKGCKHCYAERDWSRLQHLPRFAGRAFTDVACHPERIDQPLRWTKPRRIFVNSMSDLFHEDVPDEFIDQVFAAMASAKQHKFQVLTKRPQRMLDYCKTIGRHHENDRVSIADNWRMCNEGRCLPNVWLGVSVEDQVTAGQRIPLLLKTPAAVRWISVEPLLGPVNIQSAINLMPWKIGGGDSGLHWVVVGGESGPKARPMHPDWVRSLRDQCAAAWVPFMFKQWGEFSYEYDRDRDDPDWRRCGEQSANTGRWINLAGGIGFHGDRLHYARRVGKRTAGRLLDGVQHDAYPRSS